MNQHNSPKYTIIRRKDNVVVLQGNQEWLLKEYPADRYEVIINW